MGSTGRLAFPDIWDCEWMLCDSRRCPAPPRRTSNQNEARLSTRNKAQLSNRNEARLSTRNEARRPKTAKTRQSLQSIVNQDKLQKAKDARDRRFGVVTESTNSIIEKTSPPKKRVYDPSADAVFCKNIPKFFRTEDNYQLPNVDWYEKDNQVSVKTKTKDRSPSKPRNIRKTSPKEYKCMEKSIEELNVQQAQNAIKRNKLYFMNSSKNIQCAQNTETSRNIYQTDSPRAKKHIDLKTTITRKNDPRHPKTKKRTQCKPEQAILKSTNSKKDKDEKSATKCFGNDYENDTTAMDQTTYGDCRNATQAEMERDQSDSSSEEQRNRVVDWLNCGASNERFSVVRERNADIYKQLSVNREGDIGANIHTMTCASGGDHAMQIREHKVHCGENEGTQAASNSRAFVRKPLQRNCFRPFAPLRAPKERRRLALQQLSYETALSLDITESDEDSVCEGNISIPPGCYLVKGNTASIKNGSCDNNPQSEPKEITEPLAITGKSALPEMSSLPSLHVVMPPVTLTGEKECNSEDHVVVPVSSVQSLVCSHDSREPGDGAGSLASTVIDMSELTVTSDDAAEYEDEEGVDETSSVENSKCDDTYYEYEEEEQEVEVCSHISPNRIVRSTSLICSEYEGSNDDQCDSIDALSILATGKSSVNEAHSINRESRCLTNFTNISQHQKTRVSGSKSKPIAKIQASNTNKQQEKQAVMKQQDANNISYMKDQLVAQNYGQNPVNGPTKGYRGKELCEGVVMYTKDCAKDIQKQDAKQNSQDTSIFKRHKAIELCEGVMMYTSGSPCCGDYPRDENQEQKVSEDSLPDEMHQDAVILKDAQFKNFPPVDDNIKIAVKLQCFEMTETPQDSLPARGPHAYNPPGRPSRAPQRRRQCRSLCTVNRNRFKNVTSMSGLQTEDDFGLGDCDLLDVTKADKIQCIEQCEPDYIPGGDDKCEQQRMDPLVSSIAEGVFQSQNSVSVYRNTAGMCPGNEVFLAHKPPTYQIKVDHRNLDDVVDMGKDMIESTETSKEPIPYESGQIENSDVFNCCGTTDGDLESKCYTAMGAEEQQEFADMYEQYPILNTGELVEDTHFIDPHENAEYDDSSMRPSTPYSVQHFIHNTMAPMAIPLHIQTLRPFSERVGDKGTKTGNNAGEPRGFEGSRKFQTLTGSNPARMWRPDQSTQHTGPVSRARAHTLSMARQAGVRVPGYNACCGCGEDCGADHVGSVYGDDHEESICGIVPVNSICGSLPVNSISGNVPINSCGSAL